MVKHKDSALRKQEIVDGALRLFVDQGYEQTSVSQIAKKIGVAKGLVYYYFESKDEILEHVVEYLCDRHVERLEIKMDTADYDFLDRMLLFMDAYYEIHPYTESPATLSWSHNSVFAELFHNIYLKRIDGILEEIVAEGQAQGYFELKHPKGMIIMTLEGIFGLTRYGDVSRTAVVEMIEQSLNLPEQSLKEKGTILLQHFKD
ncbi:TetR/AcrR family transcriptional regulator [Erysipelothrix sp. HDW6A]|uniref:TetR/AcrR family transcriptional regulator n=1 Tax=Erysipelothrix sp. HDW6A TaxID=2714928 RepID=UPI00140BD708|nr:TetR/AcrR family transcriptional regulator [Erysipelothrix sp. HDW6A]QIK57235.1 TetR/AcrR family transcriptional regulator [Erysipelothrix sp. HDW6A]